MFVRYRLAFGNLKPEFGVRPNAPDGTAKKNSGVEVEMHERRGAQGRRILDARGN
jgi:hypothetical protein